MYLASATTATFAALGAGCLGVITGEEAAEFAAHPASVSQQMLDETEYERTDQDEHVIEREYEAAGESREVVITNIHTEYEKAIEMGPLGEQQGAVFSVLTTPQVSVLGREFNPVADMSTEELAETVQDQYDEIHRLEHDQDSQLTINGETTTQSRFTAEATYGGEAVDLYLHISEAVAAGEDLIVTIGGYPEMTPDERETILRLMESVESDG